MDSDQSNDYDSDLSDDCDADVRDDAVTFDKNIKSRLTVSREKLKEKEIPKIKKKIVQDAKLIKPQAHCNIFQIKFLLVLVPIASLLFICSACFNNSKSNFDIKTSLTYLKSQYKNQERNFWSEIYVNTERLIRYPKSISILLLVAQEPHPLNCLVESLANFSSYAFNTNSIILQPKDFQNNPGSVLISMRSIIKNNKVIIVWDLLNINVQALQAFHNLCDTINYFEEGIFYIITIIADNYDEKIQPIAFIEDELRKKLSGKIKNDNIQPLITRITDGSIIVVKSEQIVENCSSKYRILKSV